MDADSGRTALQTLAISDLGVPSATLRISGPDANTFLQGQFTQDLRVPVGGRAYGLWLNQKGKVIADGFVLHFSETEHLVWAPRTAPTILRERLESYLIADEVEIADETDQWRGAVIWGPGAENAVARDFGATPSANEFRRNGAALVFSGRFSKAANFICLSADGKITDGWIRTGASRSSRDHLEAERITSGLAAVPDDIGEHDLPNEGGLEVDAISYTKGCYLGQEVMSRLKNLGQVRRRLFVVEGEGTPPSPRTPVEQSGKSVGEIRSSARVPAGFVALAMLSLVNFNATLPLSLADGRGLRAAHG